MSAKLRKFLFLVENACIESLLFALRCLFAFISLKCMHSCTHSWILKLSYSRLWKVVIYYLAGVFSIRLLIVFTISHISITIVVIIILHIDLVFILLILWVLQVEKCCMYEWSCVVSIFIMNDTIALKFRIRKTFLTKKCSYEFERLFAANIL